MGRDWRVSIIWILTLQMCRVERQGKSRTWRFFSNGTNSCEFSLSKRHFGHSDRCVPGREVIEGQASTVVHSDADGHSCRRCSVIRLFFALMNAQKGWMLASTHRQERCPPHRCHRSETKR